MIVLTVLCEYKYYNNKYIYVRTMDAKNENNREFEAVCKELIELHQKKNSDYGDAYSEAYQKIGNGYAVGLLYNKVNRLISLLCDDKEQHVNDESVDDTLKDLASYAIMLKMERDKKRRAESIQGEIRFDKSVYEVLK